MKISVNAITPNPEQPRREFDAVEMSNLAENIRERGLIQPITVEQAGDGFILIAGERRWRAHMLLGLDEIEANITEPDEKSNGNGRFLRALAENMQRSSLTMVEEANAIARLSKTMTQQEIAREMNLSVSTVISRQMLLKLPKEIQELIIAKALPYDSRIAQAFLSLPEDQRVSIATRFAQRGTSAKWILKYCAMYGQEKIKPARKLACEKPGKMPDELPLIQADETQTVLALAVKRVKPLITEPHYNALVAAGTLPPWSSLNDAVRRECKSCDLFGNACESTCKTCPLVGLIIKLVRAEK